MRVCPVSMSETTPLIALPMPLLEMASLIRCRYAWNDIAAGTSVVAATVSAVLAEIAWIMFTACLHWPDELRKDVAIENCRKISCFIDV